MLHKFNAGKYFSKDYFRKRNIGLEDRRNLTASEQNYADISSPDGEGRFNKRTHVLHSIYKKKEYDRRRDPRIGD